MKQRFSRSLFTLIFLLLATVAMSQTSNGIIYGTVLEAKSKQPVIGASVSIEGTTIGTSTDLDGKFLLQDLPQGNYTVRISFLSFKTFVSEPLTIKGGESTALNVELVEEVSELANVVVVATRKVNSDAGVLSQMREMSLVASGTSAQAIAQTQDRDAAEVVRRIPGISILDDKFVALLNDIIMYGSTVEQYQARKRIPVRSLSTFFPAASLIT